MTALIDRLLRRDKSVAHYSLNVSPAANHTNTKMAEAGRQLGIVEVRMALHVAGLLTPEIGALIDGVRAKNAQGEQR